jgi:hypothetical protein
VTKKERAKHERAVERLAHVIWNIWADANQLFGEYDVARFVIARQKRAVKRAVAREVANAMYRRDMAERGWTRTRTYNLGKAGKAKMTHTVIVAADGLAKSYAEKGGTR